MLTRVLGSSLRRLAPAGVAPAAASQRWASEWLQGKPPSVDTAAGTVASFYYKHIRNADTPTKDHLVAPGQDVKFTVQQWDKQVYGYAVGMLESLGLKKGSKIAVWMTNELEYLVVRYAAGVLGVSVVAIDPSLGWEDVKDIISKEGVRSLIFSPRYGSEDRLSASAEVFAPELEPITKAAGYEPFASKRFRSLKHVVCTSLDFEEGIMRFRDLPVYGENGSYAADDIAAIQSYLSKTDAIYTPYSKTAAGGPVKAGASVSHEGILAHAAAAAAAAGIKPTDVVVVTAPVGEPHGFAGCMAAAGAGAKLVVPGKSFDAKGVLASAAEQGATVLVATAEQAAALAAEVASGDKTAAEGVAALRVGLLPAGSAPVTVGKAGFKALSA